MKIFGMVTTEHSQDYTAHALCSFFETTPLESDDCFYLIDNDGTYDAAGLSDYSRVKLLRNSSPLGFGQNANQMVKLAQEEKADLYFLNNDLIFTPDWIAPLAIPGRTILSPLSNRELQYNTDVFRSKTNMTLEDYLGKEEGLRQLVKVHKERNAGYFKVIAAPFFCIKIPYSVLEVVGCFDESFGKGGAEDYDYCLRAVLGGCDVKYALGSYVLHFGGKSSWSGVESRPEQEQRELAFRTAFSVKWGKELLRLVLFEDHSVLSNYAELGKEIERGNHIAVVEALRGQRRCEIML